MYIERILSTALLRLASQYPVITLTGPRQAGKTTLCRVSFPSHAYVTLEDLSLRAFATDDPKGFLAQFTGGVILDEIQRVPDLLSYIQGVVDLDPRPGRFILTGSQQFEVTQALNQSLAGRTAILRLLPFAYDELYGGGVRPSINQLIYQGFYPRIADQHLNPTEALSFYLNTYVERDLRSMLNVKNLASFERFLRLCATQVGRLTNYTQLANDAGITQNTVKEWLSILEASYILFQVQPHFENFKKRLVKSSKLYFYDVGLAAYLLGITDAEHVQAHPMRGELFENLVVVEFLKNRYNHVKDKNIYFYRDQASHEVDLVLDYGAELVAVEIKSGQTLNPDYFKGLAYYRKVCGERHLAQMLIYGGEASMRYGEVDVYNVHDVNLVFASLPR